MKSWTNQDPTGWWLSEKLDGYNAIWLSADDNFGKPCLKTKRGQDLLAPDWFIKDFPNISLVGEIWAGRGRYEIATKTISTSDHWDKVIFVVWDCPTVNALFEERQKLLEKIINPKIAIVQQTLCTGDEHLQLELNNVLKINGEGLVLTEAKSKYNFCAGNKFKLKQWIDKEAVVVGYKPGTRDGMVGALIVERDGKRFNIGTGLTDLNRKNPPSIGTTITYRYNNLYANGLPKTPAFLRVRDD